MPKLVKRALVLLLCLVSLWIGATLVIIGRNELALYRFKTRLTVLPHPEATRVIAQRSMVGLFDNGDHCDYFAGQVRETDLDEATVEAHYRGLSVTRVDPRHDQVATRVEVAFLKEGHYDVVPIPELWEPEGWPVARTRPPGKRAYAVWVFDDGYAPGFDPRCY